MKVYMGLRNNAATVAAVGRSTLQLRGGFSRITSGHLRMINGLSTEVADRIKPSERCVRVPRSLLTSAIKQLSPESRAIPSGCTGIFGDRPVSTLKDLNGLLAECLEKPGFTVKSWLVENSGVLNIYFQAINLHNSEGVVGVIVPLNVSISDRREINT